MKLKLNIIPQIYQRGPNIKIINKTSTFDFDNVTDTSLECDIDDAPTSFTIMHHNKSNNDILLEDGKIIKDTGFTLASIELNDQILKDEIFKFEISYANGTKMTGNNYFGDNCYMTINIDQPLEFWMFDLKHQKENVDYEIDVDKFVEEILS